MVIGQERKDQHYRRIQKKNIVHHKKSKKIYSKLIFNVKNGIVLCDGCHKKFHKKYGYKDFTENQLDEFLKGQNSK